MRAKFAGQKTIIFFGLLLIIGLWLSIWQQIAFDCDREIDSAAREGMNLARIYEERFRNILQEGDKSLIALREAYGREGTDGQTFRLLIGRIKGELSPTQIGKTDENGRLQFFLRESAAPLNVSDTDYFRFLRNSNDDRLHVGKTFMGRQSGQLVIPLSRRTTTPDGSFGGVFVITISPSQLIESFKAIELGPGKIMSVTGMDGVTRVRQGAGIKNQTIDVSAGLVFKSARSQPYGIVRSPNVEDGILRINAYRVIPEYNVYVNVAMSEEDALEGFEERKKGHILAGGLATLFIIGFCGVIIRKNWQHRELEKRITADAARLLALYETTSRLVTDSADTDSLLETIVHDTIRLVGAVSGLIATVNPGGDTWAICYGAGADKQRIGEERPISEGIVGEVIRRGEFIYVENYAEYRQRIAEVPLGALGSLLAFPLKEQNEILGVLAIGWTHIMPKPGGEVLNTFTQYAYLAAVALARARAHDKIQQLAYTDALTGLPNRRKIHDYLLKEMARAQTGEGCGAVLFIDLDNLKLVNDTMGHRYGDNLLIEAAGQILAIVGANAIVGRLAGDEFVVVLPDANDRLTISEITDRLIRSLDRQYHWEGSAVHASATAGVAVYPEDGSSVEDILKNADAALYVAKNKGKHSWRFYDASIQQEMHSTMVLSNSLHQALSRNELLLNYQPILTPGGVLVGFEALLRWHSPEHGQIPPSTFIPLAEQDGRLIRAIGTWVIQEACRFAGRLTGLGGENLRVEVNVSARQLETGDFYDTVMAAVGAAGIAPGQLGLEITESVLVESVQETAAQFQRLREQGINVSLDDFGEGYSSLSQLFRLPVDTIKISRILLKLLETDNRQFAFVNSVVKMAKALGLNVVAEGVETEKQLIKASECQCDFIQGYYYYRPMPEAEAIKLIARG